MEPWLWAWVLPSTPYSDACAEAIFATLGSNGPTVFLSVCTGVVFLFALIAIASGCNASFEARKADTDLIDVTVDGSGGGRKSSTVALTIRNSIFGGGRITHL